MSKDKTKDKTDPQDTGATPDVANDSLKHDAKVKGEQDRGAEAEKQGKAHGPPVGPEGPRNEFRGGGAEPVETDAAAGRNPQPTADQLQQRYGEDAYGPPQRKGGDMGGAGAIAQDTEGPDAMPRAKAGALMGALGSIDDLIEKAHAIRERIDPQGDLGTKLAQMVSLGRELRQAFKGALQTKGALPPDETTHQGGTTVSNPNQPGGQSGGQGPQPGSPGSQEKRQERHDQHDQNKAQREQERAQRKQERADQGLPPEPEEGEGEEATQQPA